MKRREVKALDVKDKQNTAGGEKKRLKLQVSKDNLTKSNKSSTTSETELEGNNICMDIEPNQRLLLSNNQTKPDNEDSPHQLQYPDSSLLVNLNPHNQQQQQQPLLLQQQQHPHQSQATMSSRSSSDNNFVSKHHFEEAKNDKMTFCFKNKWILLLSMSLTLIITAVLVAILAINLLDNEDQCFQNFPFQQPSYKLFSTKTTYSTAFSYLNHSPITNSRSIIKSVDKNFVELPNIFSKSDSLKTIHDRLTQQDNCKVKQFHYFGRHAARFPSTKGINEINKLVLAVQNRIDLSKFLSNNVNNSNNNNNNNNNSSSANSTNVCFNPLAPFKQWVSFMVPKQGNLIFESGIEDTNSIAARYKSIYPDLFNSSITKIEFGTTEELRTAQTALVFLKQLDNFNLDFCSLDEFPDNISDQSRSEEIESNKCYRLFIEKYHKEKLAFHKKCDQYQTVPFTLPYQLNLKEPNRTQFIATSVSKKLKLAKQDYLSSDEAEALYDICKYETAFTGSSIWCNLFSDKDLQFYEYLDDIEDYFNQAYGHPDQYRSACPVTTELMKAFKTVRQQFDSNSNKQSTSTPEAHFYFTHSEVIQKILAASVDLEQDPQYVPDVIKSHLKAGTTPQVRQWRTSLFTPFSANLAFTLYECPTQRNSANNEYIEIDVNRSPFKVVASLNEQPIQLDGCSDYVCDLIELTNDSRLDKERRCKLEDICKKKVVLE